MIKILCDDSTSCKEACDNNDYHRSRQWQTFNMSVKSIRISLDHFIYCIVLYKCKTIFSICGSIFIIICTVLGNVSKRSLITSVTTVHWPYNQKMNIISSVFAPKTYKYTISVLI